MADPPEPKKLKLEDEITKKISNQSNQEDVEYNCDQCDFKTAYKKNLNPHKRAKHEGIRFSCDQCEFTATKLTDLKRHKGAKHEGIRYPCDQCEFTSAYTFELRKHKAKHEIPLWVNVNIQRHGLEP